MSKKQNYLVDYAKFEKLSHRLLELIKGKENEYQGILCPLRGGFFLSYFMSNHLKLPIFYLEISSYEGQTQREFQIGLKPDLAEGKFLLCDDIYDSGKTIQEIHVMYPKVDFDTVCLISKIEKTEPEVYYGELLKSDEWVDFFWEVM